eukprot:6849-Rhodomonas_salina.8
MTVDSTKNADPGTGWSSMKEDEEAEMQLNLEDFLNILCLRLLDRSASLSLRTAHSENGVDYYQLCSDIPGHILKVGHVHSLMLPEHVTRAEATKIFRIVNRSQLLLDSEPVQNSAVSLCRVWY